MKRIVLIISLLYSVVVNAQIFPNETNATFQLVDDTLLLITDIGGTLTVNLKEVYDGYWSISGDSLITSYGKVSVDSVLTNYYGSRNSVVVIEADSFINMLSGGSVAFPAWTTATRPTAIENRCGWNTDLKKFECYNGSTWNDYWYLDGDSLKTGYTKVAIDSTFSHYYGSRSSFIAGADNGSALFINLDQDVSIGTAVYPKKFNVFGDFQLAYPADGGTYINGGGNFGFGNMAATLWLDSASQYLTFLSADTLQARMAYQSLVAPLSTSVLMRENEGEFAIGNSASGARSAFSLVRDTSNGEYYGVFESRSSNTSDRYGFSNWSITKSADMYRFDPVVELDVAGYFVKESSLTGIYRYNIIDDANYAENGFLLDTTQLFLYVDSNNVTLSLREDTIEFFTDYEIHTADSLVTITTPEFVVRDGTGVGNGSSSIILSTTGGYTTETDAVIQTLPATETTTPMIIFDANNNTDDGLILMDADSLIDMSLSKSMLPPRWTTVGRPAAVLSTFGFNIDSAKMEYYNGSVWVQLP